MSLLRLLQHILHGAVPEDHSEAITGSNAVAHILTNQSPYNHTMPALWSFTNYQTFPDKNQCWV